MLAARRKAPPLKSVAATQIKASAAFVVRGVYPHIRDEQVQKAVVVEVEEHRAGGMASGSNAKAGFERDVFEFSVAQVFEQKIPRPDRGYKQVRQAVSVDVRERSGDANLVFQTNPRGGRDVFKLSVLQIPPKLVAPKLVDEIKEIGRASCRERV